MTKNSGVPRKTVLQLARSIAAKTRQEARTERSSDEQLTLLAARPGHSRKERQRLTPKDGGS